MTNKETELREALRSTSKNSSELLRVCESLLFKFNDNQDLEYMRDELLELSLKTPYVRFDIMKNLNLLE